MCHCATLSGQEAYAPACKQADSERNTGYDPVPSRWQRGALPTELIPHKYVGGRLARHITVFRP